MAPSLSSGLYLKVTFSVRHPLANVSFPLSLLYLFLLDIITISHNMYFAYASCLSNFPPKVSWKIDFLISHRSEIFLPSHLIVWLDIKF